ncbi:MAG: hypothetical protein R2755_19170 [Acidimicrobiales bacterium]
MTTLFITKASTAISIMGRSSVVTARMRSIVETTQQADRFASRRPKAEGTRPAPVT